MRVEKKLQLENRELRRSARREGVRVENGE